MAAESDKLFESTKTSEELAKLASNLLDLEEQLPCNRNQVIRPGSQLSEKLHFHDKSGNVVSAYPVIVDFRRLLQLQNTNPTHNNDVISGISNGDLLHAVVGLYDIALSEMTLDVLYATVCEKWARTIVLVQDMKDAVKDAELRKKEKKEQPSNDKIEGNDETKLDGKMNVNIGDDKYEEEESSPSKFEGVFSDVEDDDDDDDEEEDESDEEDFSVGINSFITSAVTKRKQRNVKKKCLDEHDIGVENRIIGCLTFEKKYVRHKDRVIHLTIVTVRPRYRKYGIGKYLLSQVIDSSVSGQYEAIVVHADNGAVEFFQKLGFSDDVVLNSRWSELAEQFTNCTLMCYLPGFTGHTVLSAISLPGLEVYEMDQELKKWKDKTLESYQAQITCVMRMKQEIFNLQKKVKCQDNMIKMLAVENEKVKQEKMILEKELMIHKLNKTTNMSGGGEEEISTSDLITRLQEEVNKLECNDIKLQIGCRIDEYKDLDVYPMSPLQKHQEPYDHMIDAALFYDISQQFKETMHADPCIKIQYEVTSVHKATLSNEVKDKYKTATLALHDVNMVTQLYYCGGLEKPHRLNQIMQTGFTEQDFSNGEFGRGLYFSKYPSRAAQFSALSKLVLVEVGLGSVETVTKPDRARTKPSSDANSIITPGRLYKLEDETHESMFNQEYVIFNTKQILPLCLINYVTADHGS